MEWIYGSEVFGNKQNQISRQFDHKNKKIIKLFYEKIKIEFYKDTNYERYNLKINKKKELGPPCS